jgi:tetratricopeptide (TPR) repeat protein
MNDAILFPTYIQRDEEQQIRRQAALVKKDRRSRAVMLYGPGGVGKTRLVRELARTSATDEQVIWIEPMDIDDSEYWLLYNLEQKVADRLDPHNRYFESYRDDVAKIPQYTRPATGYDAILSHLGHVKDVFLDCYKRFAEDTGQTVVIALDTVEAIRGTYLLLTLTKWMKGLPGTLFVLSGRPTSAEIQDPIRRELESGQNRLPVIRVNLAGFTKEAALEYLNESGVARALSGEEKDKMIHLTRGHPLWLAFALDFLMERGLPEEAERPLAKITEDMPYQEQMTAKGRVLHDAFKRRLVTQYRGVHFWQEAIKRLAVVRERVNQPFWQRLMVDLEFPRDVGSWDEAWHLLLEIPWIRPRSNHRYVTLHDAVAEELAVRIIPVHDQDQQWRRRLWRRAIDICGELTESSGTEVSEQLEQMLRDRDGSSASEWSRATLEKVARLDAEKRELDQLKTSRLHYQLLSDPEEGYREFLTLLKQSSEQHDVLFQQLIALEMQRFLPIGGQPLEPGDITHGAIDIFQAWLKSNPESYLELGLRMAQYLIDNEQAESAMDLLEGQWSLDLASPDQRCRLNIHRGNACMRIPGRVKEGENYFRQALIETGTVDSEHQSKVVANAYKELGFYYRSVGRWEKADDAYSRAQDELSNIWSIRSPDEDREEMASIQTNWAYVKGLRGMLREARELVKIAIETRNGLGKTLEEGISWSVLGEMNRYDHQYSAAWNDYQNAEQLFDGLKNWSWLGLIYQEQAICLYDAVAEDQFDLLRDEGRDPYQRAETLIAQALDICRDQRVRSYPSALFRAGRIFGQKDFDKSLGCLEEAIIQARQLSDGWIWFASLIEYVEVSYQAWVKSTERSGYRQRIVERAIEIRQVMDEYEFLYLRGRWEILQGHLHLHDALDSGEESHLSEALQHYKDGFPQITGGELGSYGWGSMPKAFGIFAGLFSQLSPQTKERWSNELRLAWRGQTSLVAHLLGLH